MTHKKEAPAGQGKGQKDQKKKLHNNSIRHKKKEEKKPKKKTDAPPIPVDGKQLLDNLVALFCRHLSLPEGAAEAMALWVAFAWTFDAFDASPRLAFTSPLPECGKTTALTLLAGLVPRSIAVSNTTSPAIFRLIDKEPCTLIIDEADTFMQQRDELAGILNSGHARATANILRCVGDSHEPRSFSTWAPLVIARIGALDPALESRSIVIEMQRDGPGERIERVTSTVVSDLEPLHDRLELWAQQHVDELREADPKIPEGFRGRLADNWRPLIAIAEAVCTSWLDRARAIAKQLTGEIEPPDAIRLLGSIKRVFDQKGTDKLRSSDLCNALNRHSPDDIQIRGNLTTDPPPSERHPVCSHPVA
ncbi:MAG: DUF3631 domain-containing protein [Proteobacteria bacterium]|nr:DUF3631 domain-containing protein [Pseudomonadota bacterium]